MSVTWKRLAELVAESWVPYGDYEFVRSFSPGELARLIQEEAAKEEAPKAGDTRRRGRQHCRVMCAKFGITARCQRALPCPVHAQ